MATDFVILWVDGSDPAWQAEKARFTPPEFPEADSANRYRDWGLLPYWFRGVEQYAPWVNRIHFVTWGHLPPWLNPDAPKLNLVRHRDFLPEEICPTFSSHAIELNLHRIPGLSEQFVYFNDDMFLLRPMAETDFFLHGLPRACGSEEPWVFRGDVGIWAHAAANDLGIINAHFPKTLAVAAHGRKYRNRCYRWQDNLRTLALEKLFPGAFTGFPNFHAPAAYRKSTFQAVWAAEPALLAETCRHRFRNPGDVNQWLFLWWQIASGAFMPRRQNHLTLHADNACLSVLEDAIRSQRYETVCIQDPRISEDPEASALRLRRAFEEILPEKSVFEK